MRDNIDSELWVTLSQDIYILIIVINQSKMQQNTKWTVEQDQRLMAAVRKHGTQWGLVGKQINHTRSQNAIIKRWHGYLRRSFQQTVPVNKTVQVVEKNEEKVKTQKKVKQSESSQEQEIIDENQEREKTERENIEKIKKIQQEPFQFKFHWSQQDDTKLKNLIINDGILFWDKLASMFNTTTQEVMTRWIKCICPKLKNNVKIGGALKWSINQDYILYSADRNKISHLDLMFFLTCRTVYSIQARWRRICKNSQIMNHLTVLNNRNNIRREALKKIAMKKCTQKKDIMSKIYEKQRQIIDKQKLEQEKFEMMRRQDKMRKIERM